MDETGICLYLWCCSRMSARMAGAPFPQQQLRESGSSTPAHLCCARCDCGTTTTASWANLRLKNWQQRTWGSVEPQAVRGYSIYPSCWVYSQFIRKSKLLYSSTRTWTRISVYTCSQVSRLAGLGSKPGIHSKIKLLQNKAHLGTRILQKRSETSC